MVCKTVQIPNEDDEKNGSGNGGGGAEPPPPNEPTDSPNLSGPNVTNIQTVTEQAQITYSISNSGTASGTMTVEGTIDLGATGTIDATKTQQVAVAPGNTEYRVFEFLPELDDGTEAIVCVKEV